MNADTMILAPSAAGLRAIVPALRATLQWRLLLLWTVIQLLPTAVVALPVWLLLGGAFDHSVQAAALAQRLDLLSIPELIALFQHNGLALGTSSIVALLVALLLMPLQTALVIAAARAAGCTANRIPTRTPTRTPLYAPITANFGTLFSGAAAAYGRMLRLLLWAVVPLGTAVALGTAAVNAAATHNESASLYIDAQIVSVMATVLAVLLFLIAAATLDAARAVLAADPRRRSVVKAWWAGLALLWRRPAIFGVYGLISVAGLLLAAVLGVLRLNLPHADIAGGVAAFFITQLMVAVLAWTRSARLFALIASVPVRQ